LRRVRLCAKALSMRAPVPGLASRRLAALLLIAAALLMRIAVPGGWMPDASAHGWRIIPCSGMAPAGHAHPAMAGMANHIDAGQAPAKHDHASESPCDFAAAAQAASLPDFVPAPAPGFEARPAVPPARLPDSVPGRGLAAPPPPSTGPPPLA
jgi:hypothetical protein